MASSSQNNFDLNAVPNVQPEIRHSSSLSQKDPFMTNASVMLDDAVAASVARGIITPQDEKLLANRTDEAINDSYGTQYSVCFFCFFKYGLTSATKGIRSLQQLRIKSWKKLIDSYANDMGKKYSELEITLTVFGSNRRVSCLKSRKRFSRPEA
ncbi:hypothetical protein Acr_15g0008400 [Actinidia rufa]|uniref:Uncharacterized protein n=1 Tax=Actinidia rufa TaxID=165716 RepID=A0A7J0FU56_9ERIC|nr:hypothetical protein Acr_15g0008400 [Actinidia rufa]